MAKVGITNQFFSRYFLGVLTRFMAGDTHSLLFSNILLMRHQSSADAIGEEKIELFFNLRSKSSDMGMFRHTIFVAFVTCEVLLVALIL